jgi:hypothetical protein
MATLAEQASKLLDFNQKLDINLLDNIVGCMYSGVGEQVCIFEILCVFQPLINVLDMWNSMIVRIIAQDV